MSIGSFLSRFRGRFTSDAVVPRDDGAARYYDAFTHTYVQTTGEFLQAFRGQDTDALMRYIAQGAGLADGMRILDAGCGVGAPALWIAQHFAGTHVDCLTNSEVQLRLTRDAIDQAGLAERVTVRLGDYHCLANDSPAARYDRVLFLESLGHAHNLDAVLYGIAHCLKQGGSCYIKDFFKRYGGDAAVQSAIDHAIAVINENYAYHVMDLATLIDGLMRHRVTPTLVKAPTIEPDLGLTIAFEHAAKRLTYPVFGSVHAVDWYEIVAVRD